MSFYSRTASLLTGCTLAVLSLFGCAAPSQPASVQYHAEKLAEPKGRILVVLTNHADYPSRKDHTGLWVTELTHFFEVADQAGFTMDFVSPKGGSVPLDERSLKPLYMDKQAYAYLADPEFAGRLKNTLQPKQVDARNYQAVYFTGGHGTMWDFANNPELTVLAENVYRQGGIVSAVCHGVAGLLSLKDGTGEPLIKGRNVTGFSNQEEWLSGMKKQVPFFLQDALIA
ncbi:MAG: type 1 glutamine amidotransferase domain-containing protein, partial [Neisseria sp.]|nr:type 1 glutamine amidotransferase domain-containing protein [Neisseria sp.]